MDKIRLNEYDCFTEALKEDNFVFAEEYDDEPIDGKERSCDDTEEGCWFKNAARIIRVID